MTELPPAVIRESAGQTLSCGLWSCPGPGPGGGVFLEMRTREHEPGRSTGSCMAGGRMISRRWLDVHL